MKHPMINPRQITLETIARACDAAVALWIQWMREEDWVQEHMRTRNVAEWVASAARNAWVMHDNCDANIVVHDAMAAMGLYVGDPDEIPDDEDVAAYNHAIWWAVAHQAEPIHRARLVRYLRRQHGMTGSEIAGLLQILMNAPEDGLEQACARAWPALPETVNPDNVSGVSDQEAMLAFIVDLPPEELHRRANEALEQCEEGTQQSARRRNGTRRSR